MKMTIKNYLNADLVLGSLIVFGGFSGCWAVAAGAGGEAAYVATQENRSAGETLTDQRIVSTIKTKMIGDPDVDGLDINVDSMRGNVTLKGFVKNQQSADKAIQIANSVEGVKTVHSRLVLN